MEQNYSVNFINSALLSTL